MEDSSVDEYMCDKFTIIYDTIALFKMNLTALHRDVKNIEKEFKQKIKNAKKNQKPERVKNQKAPSGFAKPTKVTNEICRFMNLPDGSEVARTEVTKALVNYIKSHNLVESTEELKTKIILDKKLKDLFNIPDGENICLNFFNMQRYMNRHFYSKKSTSCPDFQSQEEKQTQQTQTYEDTHNDPDDPDDGDYDDTEYDEDINDEDYELTC